MFPVGGRQVRGARRTGPARPGTAQRGAAPLQDKCAAAVPRHEACHSDYAAPLPPGTRRTDETITVRR